MSWQTYVDDQLLASKHVTHAVICGHDGNIWAKSKDFNVTHEELKAIISKFHDTMQLAATGVTIAGTKYIYLSGKSDDPLKVIRGKKDQNGFVGVKTAQTYVCTVYLEPIQPQQAAVATEKLGEYLLSQNF